MPRSGTGRVYQRGNVWWIQYGHRGETYRESSKSEKKRDATDLLKKRLAEMGAGQLVGPSAERVTFEDLMRMIRDDYVAKRRRSLKQPAAALAEGVEKLARLHGAPSEPSKVLPMR